MALLNSLYSGVSGLTSHQDMMDVISDNVSNVNTTGYKGSRITFSDTFSTILSSGTNGSSGSGGTNTVQIGLGVQTSSVSQNWDQGTLSSTGITTDLALDGDGLFILDYNGTTYYSRAGTFEFDEDGYLVDSSTGAIVQGKNANDEGDVAPGTTLEDIQIDTNMTLPAEATTYISWGGNLESSSDVTRSESVALSGNIQDDGDWTDATATTVSTTVYDTYGNEYTVEVTYTETGNANEYDMTWEVLDSEGNSVGTSSAAVTLEFYENSDGEYVLTDASEDLFDTDSATYDSNTAVVFSSTDTNAGEINFQFETSSTLTNDNGTETATVTADGGREANIVTSSVTVYDSLGNSHTVTLSFTKLDTNTWTWTATVDGEDTSSGQDVSTSGTLTFNSDGSLDESGISPSDPTLSFTPSDGAEVLTISLDLGDGSDGVTQTSDSSAVSSLDSDGSATASLEDITIDEDGNITGVFSNGNSQVLSQIMIATFSNYNGLVSEGNNYYTAYANSGDAVITSLSDSSTTVESGYLEESNVDLSEEFTDLIIAQRGFQACSRLITTSDELLEEITNLVR